VTRAAVVASPHDVVKRCACGASYTAATWAALVLVGHVDDDGERVELRNCGACGSTIALAFDGPLTVRF
jgi:hypothetical protein